MTRIDMYPPTMPFGSNMDLSNEIIKMRLNDSLDDMLDYVENMEDIK